MEMHYGFVGFIVLVLVVLVVLVVYVVVMCEWMCFGVCVRVRAGGW